MSTLAAARGVIAGAHEPAADHRARATASRLLFGLVVALLALGCLTVYTSSAPLSLDRFGTPHHYVMRHLLHLVAGASVLTLLWRLDYRRLDRAAVVNGLWALALVLLVACLFEDPAGGARRWIRMGALSFQPSELAKLAVVVAAAFQLSRRADRLADAWNGLLPPAILCGQLAILVALQPDFGTATMLVLLLGLVALVAGTPWRVLAIHGAVACGALALFLVQEPYRLARLRTFLEPDADPLGAGFQLRQSLMALGTGGLIGRSHDGILGTGFGCSLQKLFYLPEPHTDFVFSVLGEELGLLGTLSVVALFVGVLVLGLRIAASATTSFGTLLATGCTGIMALQALLNVLVVTGLVPTKGVPLPFLSAGGSSLVVSCAAAGLVLSVARHD